MGGGRWNPLSGILQIPWVCSNKTITCCSEPLSLPLPSRPPPCKCKCPFGETVRYSKPLFVAIINVSAKTTLALQWHRQLVRWESQFQQRGHLMCGSPNFQWKQGTWLLLASFNCFCICSSTSCAERSACDWKKLSSLAIHSRSSVLLFRTHLPMHCTLWNSS